MQRYLVTGGGGGGGGGAWAIVHSLSCQLIIKERFKRTCLGSTLTIVPLWLSLEIGGVYLLLHAFDLTHLSGIKSLSQPPFRECHRLLFYKPCYNRLCESYHIWAYCCPFICDCRTIKDTLNPQNNGNKRSQTEAKFF